MNSLSKICGPNFRQKPLKPKAFDNVLDPTKVGVLATDPDQPPREIASDIAIPLDIAAKWKASAEQRLKIIDWYNRITHIKRTAELNPIFQGDCEQQLEKIKWEIDFSYGPGTDIFYQLNELPGDVSVAAELPAKKNDFSKPLNPHKVGVFRGGTKPRLGYRADPVQPKKFVENRADLEVFLRRNYYFIDWSIRLKELKSQQEHRMTKQSAEQGIQKIKDEIDAVFGRGTDVFERLHELASSDSHLDIEDVMKKW
ncbi:MAG: hypothetical protein KIT80_16070 [Chitinophagaceae bacterium]|nr:hypothetical protein [Chitinophagaceae bacterium]MCW5928433.1 hypothetical protein [Chitinophagaceae bacterium]